MSNALSAMTELQQLAAEGNRLYTEFYGSKKDSLMFGLELGGVLRRGKAIAKHGEFRKWLAENFEFGKSWASVCMRAHEALELMAANGHMSSPLDISTVQSMEHLAAWLPTAKEGLDPRATQRARPVGAPKGPARPDPEAFTEHVAAEVDNIVDEREAAHSDLQNEVIRLRERVAELETENAMLRAQLSSKETQ